MSMEKVRDLHEWADVAERNVLVLNYTMTCPLACDFCCYGCHPKRTEKMPLDKARDLISQAAQLDVFSSVGFTGGEVFAYEDDFLELADHLKAVGLPFTAATAGHWGKSKKHADDLAERLVSRGLRRINISCDTSHAEFVPVESVVNAATAMAQQGIPVYIVGTFADPKDDLERMLPELSGHPGIRMFSKRIAQVGRAKKTRLPPRAANNYEGTCYRRIYHDIVVFWDGKTYPCCSTFNRATKGLCVGNAFEESLEAIWRRVDNSPLFLMLKRRGFGELYEAVAKYNPELYQQLPPLNSSPGPCSLCNAMFSKDSVRAGVEAVADELFVDELLASTNALQQRSIGGLLRAPPSDHSGATGGADHG
ncbi:MAG TPA: radical SAM protein [Beijerinckiaceae bacterium]|jgi:hypothetical protein